MTSFIARASKPDWCSDLECIVSDEVSRCANATLFGSWASGEETLLLMDDQYHVMSDIDVSYVGRPEAMRLLQKSLDSIIPCVRIDYSDAFAFANKNQTKQRLLGPAQVLESSIEKQEIAEAVAIRVFYSSLDIWLGARNLDIQGAIYSLVRMIAEIPLYYCWNSGLICGSYQTQLDVAVDRTSITQLEAFDLVKFCVQCKKTVMVLQSDIDGRDVHRLFIKYIDLFAGVIRALALGHLKYGEVSLRLLEILRVSLKPNLALDLKCVGTAWKCYKESILDGRVRSQYLSKRIHDLRRAPYKGLQATHFSICLGERLARPNSAKSSVRGSNANRP